MQIIRKKSEIIALMGMKTPTKFQFDLPKGLKVRAKMAAALLPEARTTSGDKSTQTESQKSPH
jgi:hypothetical protein